MGLKSLIEKGVVTKYLLIVVGVFFGIFISATYAQISRTNLHNDDIDSLMVARDNSDLKPRQRLHAQENIVILTLYKNPDEGYPEVLRMLEMSRAYEFREIEAHAYDCLVYYFRNKNMPDSAEIYIMKGLNIAKLSGNKYHQLQSYTELVILEEMRGNYDLAAKKYMTLIDSAVMYNIKWSEARARINLGNIFNLQGKYQEAFEHLKLALALCNKYHIDGYKASTLIYLGDLYRMVGEWDVAENYYHESIKWSEIRNNLGLKLLSLEMLVKIDLIKGEIDLAKRKAWNIIDLSRKGASRNRLVDAHVLMAEILLRDSQVDSAEWYIDQVERYYRSLKIKENIHRFYSTAGKVYYEKQRYSAAFRYFKLSYDAASKVNELEIQLDNCYFLSHLYSIKGDYEIANRFLREYAELLKRKQNIEDAKGLVKFNLKRSFDQKRFNDSLANIRILNDLKVAHRIRFEEQQFWVTIGVTVAGFLTVLLIIVYIFLRKSKIEKKKSDKLNEINRQIFSIISHDLYGPLDNVHFLLSELESTEWDTKRIKDSYFPLVQDHLQATKRILKDILVWSESELSFENRGTAQCTNLLNVVNEIISANQQNLAMKNLDVLVNVEENFELPVKRMILTSIMANIVSNSIKFSFPDSTISIEHVQSERVIKICDEGIGISPEKQALIFKSVVLSHLGTKLESGFGMGLYLVQILVNKSGWRISILSSDSGENRGTTVLLYY